MDQNVNGNTFVLNLVLKGGPPWGFRIKERGTKVIISKVNCGGRAHKNGLKVNDEIVAVNNLEIDKHPLTLARNVDESNVEEIESQSIKLTKLDFTYQLIKHTLNRHLHLTTRRHTNLEIVQPCCYFIEDDTNTEDAYQVQNQSEEEILSPGEEVETVDNQSHHHSHSQPSSTDHQHHHHPPQQQPQQQPHHQHQQPHHPYHHHQPEAALIPCPGTTVILAPRLSQPESQSSIGFICDQFQTNETTCNNTNHRHHHSFKSENDLRGCGIIISGRRIENGESDLNNNNNSSRLGDNQLIVDINRQEDSNHLPPEIPPLPPSPLHHHHHPFHLHNQFYSNSYSGFPSLEALEEHHRQYHQLPEPQYHQQPPPPPHLHYPLFPQHFHLPSHRSSTLDSPFGGSEFHLPRSPESEDSDMASVIKGPTHKARAPKNIWSPGSTTTSSSSDLTSTPAAVTPGPLTMASATQTTPTRSESLNIIKCNTLPHGFRPVKMSLTNNNMNDNNNNNTDSFLDGSNMLMMDPRTSSTTASSPTFVGALVASSVINTNTTNTNSGDDNSFNVTPSSPSETTSVRQPGSLVSPTVSQTGVSQVNTNKVNSSSSSNNHQVARSPSEQGETSSDVPSAPAQPPTPPSKTVFASTSQDPTKYWTLPRQSSASSTAGTAGSYHQDNLASSSSDYPTDPNISSIVTDKAPPRNAKFLYETPTAKYYTLPTSHTEVRSSVLPPPPKYEGIGPVNEVGVPLSLRSGVKDEYGSDWYKTMYKRLHRCDRPRSELDQPIRVKLKSSRGRDRMDPDYFSEDENTSRIPPRNIADYEPGRSSISLREKHKDSSSETNEDLVNRVINANQTHHPRPRSLEDTHRRHTISKRDLHHKNCVFNALTSPNGYESDSSYIIKKKEPRSAPVPASRSTYCAVQRGDMDIPFSGLQKPAPAPRAHKESPHRFDEGEVNIHYKTPIQTLVKGEGHPFNIDDLSKFQREMMRLNSGSECERTNYTKDLQRKHHFTPNQESIVHLDRYQNAYAHNVDSYSSQLLARVLFNFHALSGREISVKKGDIVIIHKPVNHHWVEVEDPQSGLKGLVPRSYLDYEQEGIAKAKYDFDAKTSVEISFKKGDVLKLIRKVDENWYEGINQKGLMGIFPCSYVETLKTPLYLQLNNHLINRFNQCHNGKDDGGGGVASVGDPQGSTVSSSSRPNFVPIRGGSISSSSQLQQPHHHSESRSSLQDSQRHSHSHRHRPHSPPRPMSPRFGFSSFDPAMIPGSRNKRLSRDLSDNSSVSRRREILNELSSSSANGIKSKLYRVLYPYKPRQVDELELFPGDLLAVSMHCDDGWFVGYSALTGNYGTFPGNYVEPLM